MEKRKNYSVRIPLDQVDRVEGLLREEGLKRREVKNTLWSYEGKDVYLNLYPSGTLLIQGKEAGTWTDKVLQSIELPKGPLAGCDEVGKGDIFGPLVLCCAVIPPENFRAVLSLSPKDSKNMKDEEITAKAKELKKLVKVKCITLMPERFNELYGEYGNMNRLMDDAYIKLIKAVIDEFKPVRIVVDRYSSRNPFQSFREVEFMEKGERDVAVSVASIMARAKFLERMGKLEKETGIELPKGASSEVKEVLERLRRTQPDILKKLAKGSFGGR
ncbi:ribonuclease HIII [Hydrogenivirga sp.]